MGEEEDTHLGGLDPLPFTPYSPRAQPQSSASMLEALHQLQRGSKWD